MTAGETVIRPARPDDEQALQAVDAVAWDRTSLFPSVLARAGTEPFFADDHPPEAHLVAERAGRVVGAVTWYGDAEGLGWPSGWAGLRALGVDPAARGHGVGRALVEACRRWALAAGAPVLCLHTAGFMAAAVALYEAMGFRRDPSFDFEATSRLRVGGIQPVRILAYRLDLPQDRP